uniref:Protocadherin-1 n=1 Tax=Schistosoma haematobium TaxID=6185 RepID=A0A095BXE9_SCHHA
MELWRQNAKNYMIFLILIIIFINQLIKIKGICMKSSTESIAITYEIIEESITPMIVGNLKKDLCIDQYYNQNTNDELLLHNNNDNDNKQAITHEFVLFPTSQPFYQYFKIKTDIVTNYNEQYLILNQSIDREQLCSITNGLHSSHTKLLQSNYIKHQQQQQSQYYNDDMNTLCNCNHLLGWCTIYLHLALIPFYNNQSNHQIDLLNISLLINHTQQIKKNIDYWLNSISIMEFFIIELKIIDINDNQPIFNPSHYKIIISESDKPGMIYRLPIAFDQDIGMNSMLFYNIVSINGTNNQGNIIQLYSINNNNSDYNEQLFILIQETNPKLPFIASHSLEQIEIHKLYIKLIQPLDRELYHHYDIIIIAMDKPLNNHHHHHHHQKTGTLDLIIEIADINDELPKFQHKQYEFHIRENLPSGSIIGQVNAIDLDDGLNSMINYTIKEMKPFINHNHNHNNHDYYDYYNELIYIDSITGEIKLYTMIDREKLLKIHLIIEAKDNGQPSRSSLTNVIIHIDDINDNSPMIDLWGYKEILNSTGLLIHNNNNNNNNNNDNNNIHHSNLMPFYLISSQGPLIPVHIWVSEYLNPRSIISIVKVNDLDQGINGTVQCILNDSYFILQPATPNTNTNNDQQLRSYYVILSKSLDYELQIIHHIPIICYDLGIPLSKTSTILLNIHIKDENDNEPKFLLPEIYQPAQWINKEQFLSNNQQMNNNLNSIFDFHKTLFNLKMIPLEIIIPETCSMNSIILKFPVLDIDNGINSIINYQLQLINQYPINQYNNNNQSIEIDNMIDFIQINNQTGQIIIIKSLKLIPEYIKYIYELIVTDQGIPSKLSKLYFSLQIIIVNSYPPDIELIQLSNITIIELYKNNFNKKYEIELYENQPINIQLAKLIGYDPDRGDAGRITYKLIQNLMKTCKGSYQQLNNTIEIDPNNGIITIMKSLDRELDGNLILLTIHIHDYGIPMYTTTTYIDIKILDRNDNPPLFILPLRSCHKLDLISDTTNLYDIIPCNNLLHNNPLSYNTSINQTYNMTMLLPKQSKQNILYPFAQFKAIDYDLGLNALITYYINENCSKFNVFNETTIHHSLFIIDKHSGCLSIILKFTTKTLDTTYYFCIIAKDHGELIQHYKEEQQEQQQREQQHEHTLTPIIRILLCITTTIGGLMIIIVGILSIKQPKWLICNLCRRNSKETAKAELLRFHEGKYSIHVYIYVIS